MTLLLLLGLVLLLGLFGGRLFEALGIPQVVAYIVTGVILGDSVTHTLHRDFLDVFSPLLYIALAFIGFMVGGELKGSLFKKYGKQFLVILLSEGLLAMTFVTVLVTLWTKDLGVGILLGALSSATAPAATVDVLWQYRSKGPLTSTILAIVALDDGLALILYGFAFSYATTLVSGVPLSFKVMVVDPLLEIFGALLTGAVVGLMLDQALRLFAKESDRLVGITGAIFIATGIAVKLGFSLILTNMAIGLVLANFNAERNETDFAIIRTFVPPIYVIFFIFVGARLNLSLLPAMGVIGVLYVAGRTGGKWLGAYLGARLSGSPETVRKYLGFSLFSQAGVAIGLSLDIYTHFRRYGAAGAHMGQTIVNIISATTLLVQVIGPPALKYAISHAGEIPGASPPKEA
jgi:Kef-type K+ transport system membrane component KefB